MIRKNATWVCPECTHKGKVEYIYSLNDYYFIFDDTITPRRAAEFLNPDQSYVSKYLLKKAGYKRTGKTSASKYLLNYKPMNY